MFQRLCASYFLNSLEVERALRHMLKTDWCLVEGDWNPLNNGNVIAYNTTEWLARVPQLLQNCLV